MCKKEKLAFGIALLAAATSCSVDEITIPAEELFHREFIKSYGKIDPNQDWSVIKRSSITVSTSQSADVRVYARSAEGKTSLVASYREVNGSETIYFDVAKDVEEVYVQSGTFFERVPLESSVTITNADRSRGISGTDALAVETENGYYWGPEYITAIQKVLPEGKNTNLSSTEVTSDFSFVSTGEKFVIYPIYWQTTANDVLGVYWYERGQMKTKDIFDNKVMVNGSAYHNIYHRSSVIKVNQTVPMSNQEEVGYSGTISLTFNRSVSQVANHGLSATISSGRLTSGPTQKGNTIEYTYERLDKDQTVTFTLPAGMYETAETLDKDGSKALNNEYSFSFKTFATPRHSKVEYEVTETTAKAVLEFTHPIIVDNSAFSLSPEAQVDNIIMSDDKKKVTLQLSGLTHSTKYKLVIDSSKLRSVNDNNITADISGFTNDTFETLAKDLTYEDKATVVKFTTKMNGSGQITNADGALITSGESIVSENDGFTATILFPATFNKDGVERPVIPKASNANTSSLKYPVAGQENDATFEFGFRMKTKDLSNFTDDLKACVDGTEYSIIEIIPKADILLTVYAYREGENEVNYPLVWDNENKQDLTSVSNWESAPGLYEFTSTDKDGKDVTSAFRAFSASYELKAFKAYTIHVAKSKQNRVAGLSYQLAIDDAATASRSSARRVYTYNNASRAGEDGANTIDLGNNGTIPQFYENGESPESHEFVRTAQTSKDAVNSDGKDEVLTHKVSFTLPKGVIFGFYLRNSNGAIRVTQPGEGPAVPYTCYSMSSLNQELENSFFHKLDFNCEGSEAGYFKDGWGTLVGGKFHEGLQEGANKLQMINVPENRKHSTAMTYTVDVNGQEMRYFSFEDWVDYDFNDIAFMVAPESAQDLDIIDLEVDTDPYIFAVEDLGGTTSSDIDFNDAVFAVEHVAANDKSTNCLFVTMLAAGGTYPIQLMFDGIDVDGTSKGGIVEAQSIVHGPYTGSGKTLGHINEWFNISSQNTTINVAGDHYAGFGNLTTVRIDINDDNYTLAAKEGDKGKFSIRVARPDGTHTTIEPPSEKGTAPQFLILPCSWRWPQEGKAIHDAYPGGISAGGSRFGSFQDWVNNGYDYTFKDDPKNQWHHNPTLHLIMDHAWRGSQAARELISKLKSPSAIN